MSISNIKFIVFLLLTISISSKIIAQETKKQKEFLKKIEELHKPTYKIRDSLTIQYKVITQKIGYTNDTVIKNDLHKKLEELDLISEKNNIKELESELNFIKEHPSNKISLDILYHKVTKKEAANFCENFLVLFNSFTNELKNSQKGKELSKMLVNFKNSNIGSQAPDFVVKDIGYKTFSLSSYQNNSYILLNFWKTDSKVCIEELPFLKDIHKNYNQNGFEIINICLDESLEQLIQLLRSEKIDVWRNVSVVLNDNSLLETYFVNAIPQKILIDKNGIIIDRWTGSSKLTHYKINTTLLDLFQKNSSKKY